MARAMGSKVDFRTEYVPSIIFRPAGPYACRGIGAAQAITRSSRGIRSSRGTVRLQACRRKVTRLKVILRVRTRVGIRAGTRRSSQVRAFWPSQPHAPSIPSATIPAMCSCADLQKLHVLSKLPACPHVQAMDHPMGQARTTTTTHRLSKGGLMVAWATWDQQRLAHWVAPLWGT